MQRLDQVLDHRVTLISTPPGYGKSTLVAQWLESSNHAAAWISLDADDNDSASFFRYLVAAIEAIDPGLVTKTNRIRRERSGVPVRTLVNSLATELTAATRPLLLIFDDFHLIQAPDILEGIGTLLTYAPPTLRIVLLSRADPRLPLMRMRAQGELFALGPADLGFTVEETRTLLCDRYELALDKSQLTFLQSWSEGWPLGLVLLGQALREREHEQLSVIIDRFSHNPNFITEYLWKELTLRQPADRQAFLLQTSILSQFNPRVCDAVTGRADSQSTLAALKEENLFLIPIGERGAWYRYHHLFGDVLRERLAGAFPKTEILELHRRAAHWFLTEGLIQEASSHAIKSQDWELAIRILKPWTTELFQRERLTSLRNVLDMVPEDVLIQDPELSFQFAWASIRTGRASRSRVYADAAEKGWVAAGDTVGIGRILSIRALEDFLFNRNQQGIERCNHALSLLSEEWIDDRARVFGILGNLHTQLGDFPEAEEALLRCRLLAREIGSWPLQLVEMNASALCLMGRAELDEAETLFQRVIATGDEWQDLPVIFAHSHLASIYLDQHRLDAAEQLLERALELAERLSAHIHLVRVHCLLAELGWARHDPASALVEFERAIATGASDGFGSELRNGHAQLAHFWIQQGKLNLARTWSTEINLNLDEPSDFSRSSEYLVLIELMARTGMSGRALASLAIEIPIARERSRFDHLLRMLVLRSFILRSQGRPEESRLALLEALDIGAAHGYIRPFLAFGPDLNDQLIELSRTSTHAHYIRRILDEIQHGQRLEGTGELPPNPLSERQIEILRLVAAGLSNRDIADQLFISEQTAKKHMANIYLRLEVSSRTQAVATASRLRLL